MMEIASANYMPEPGMEDPTLFQQYTMDSFACPFDNFDFESPESDSFHDHCFNFNLESTPNCFSVESPNYQSVAPAARATKKHKSSSANYLITPIPKLISFEQSNAPSIAAAYSQQFFNLGGYGIKPNVFEKRDFATLVSQGRSYEDQIFSNYDHNRPNQTIRNPTQAQEHVIAERKRREKLTRSFIALSAIVPGLKKMDKASVLGDAIKYLKQLQERVQALEDEAAKKKAGSAVLLKRSILFTDGDDGSSNDGNNCDQPLPEIEVRVSSKDILIKIQCDKLSGRVATVLGELEKHHLTVQSSSFMPFGNNIVDVTIVAQMNEENCVTAKDLLGSLRQALRQSI